MITIKEAKKLIARLDITKSTTSTDLRRMLKEKGYSGSEYRISDGASKLCIIFKNANFVVKWTSNPYTPDKDYDEAYDEVLIYEKAVEAGLEMFFPQTEVLLINNGIVFVIQEKIDFSSLNTPMATEDRYIYKTKTVSPAIIEKMEDCFTNLNRGRDLDITWASMAIVLYGKKKCKALCRFVIENNINDLHRSNIGYLKNRPIILDFSGYHRN